MRMFVQAFLAFLSLTLGVSGAQADVVAFGDPAKVWSGLAHAPESSGQDQNGVPDLLGGSFTYNAAHALTSITLNYANIHFNQPSWNSSWNSMSTGDWFFDVDNDNGWDYVIHKPSQVWDFTAHRMVTNSSYHLYYAEDEWLYGSETLYKHGKFLQYNAYYGGTDNRDWHPTTIKDDGLPYDKQVKKNGAWVTVSSNGNSGIEDLGIVDFDGWDKIGNLTKESNFLGLGSSTWDLSKIGGLPLIALAGQEITFAFTMACANDVLYDQTLVPAPEPGTMLLMGLGVLGFGFLRRRRRSLR